VPWCSAGWSATADTCLSWFHAVDKAGYPSVFRVRYAFHAVTSMDSVDAQS